LYEYVPITDADPPGSDNMAYVNVAASTTVTVKVPLYADGVHPVTVIVWPVDRPWFVTVTAVAVVVAFVSDAIIAPANVW
jgi:hypothetical protein